MATPPVQVGTLQQGLLAYIAGRRAWWANGRPRGDMPRAMVDMEARLNRPWHETLEVGHWRRAVRLASHLAAVQRQPTLLACRYGTGAAGVELMVEATGLSFLRLSNGLVSATELENARLAAEGFFGSPLYLTDADDGLDWDQFEAGQFRCIVLDWPMDARFEQSLLERRGVGSVRVLSPIGTLPRNARRH